MQTFWNWLKTYNASTHALALIIVALSAAYAGYQPFHDLVQGWYGLLPSAVQTLIGTALFIYALYKTGALKPNLQNYNKMIFGALFLGLGLLSTAAMAQTPTPVSSTPAGFVASSDVLAIDCNGAWGAGNLTTESYDFLDYGASKSNRIFAQGLELTAPNCGVSIFGGGVLWQPDLSTLLKKTNFPTGNVLTFLDASIGNGIPATGSDRVSGVLGGGFRYILSDNLTWNTIRCEVVFFGASRYPACSTGITAYFGGAPASAAKSSNVRRAMQRKIAAFQTKLSGR